MPTTKYWTGSQWVPIPGPPAGQVWTQAFGDGVNTAFQVWHGLGSRNVIVAVYRNSAPYDEVECDVERTDPNTVTLRTLPYVPTANEFIVAVASGGAQATLNIAMDTWHTVGAVGEPAFGPGWQNLGGANGIPMGFRKSPDGRVSIKGVVQFLTGAGAGIITLPVGYRPTNYVRFALPSAKGAVYTDISPAGLMSYSSQPGFGSALVNGDWLDLTTVEFDTESVNQVASIVAQPFDAVHLVGNPGEPAFQNSWVNNATGMPARFRKFPDGRVRLQGQVSNGGTGTTVFVLPAGYRPPARIDVAIGGNNAPTVLTIFNTGEVIPAAAGGVTRIELDGVEFDTETVNGYVTGSFPYLPVTMDNWHVVGAAGEPAFATGGAGGNWATNPAAGYTNLKFRKYPDGKVKLSGMAKPTSFVTNDPVFTLPIGYRPPANLIFSVRASGASAGQELANNVTVQSNGVVICVSGGTANPAGWVSFDGIEFDVEDVRQVASSAAQPLDAIHTVGAAGEPAFQNGWVPYGAAPVNPPPRFRKYPDGRVRLAGILKTGASGAIAFTLPVGYRPPADNFAFPVQAYNGVGFIQITSAGAVTPVNQGSTGVSTYVWLDGVEFDTESQSSYPSAFVQINAPPRVTSLPVAPVDGQECYLAVDTAAAYGGPYLWHCRYNASLSGTSKWEVIAGSALRVEGIGGRNWNAAGVTTQSLNYAALSDGLGPNIAVPSAGVYEMECKSVASGVAGTLAGIYMNVTGDAALDWAQGDAVVVPAAAGHGGTVFGRRTRSIAAGATVSVYYASSNASNAMKFYDRALYLRPIRIG